MKAGKIHPLSRVYEIQDLGVKFDSRLDFKQHIREINSKCLRCLGFILRITKDFDDISLVKVLYFAFVRSVLEYNAILWYPDQKVLQDCLERIQKKFLNVLFYRCNGFYPAFPNSISYNTLCNMLQIDSIFSRVKRTKLLFLFKLFNGHICDSYLLSECKISVPISGLRAISNRFFQFIISHIRGTVQRSVAGPKRLGVGKCSIPYFSKYSPRT